MGNKFFSKSHMRLQSQFLFGLAAILIFFSAVASSLIYIYEQRALEKEIYEKSELVMQTMAANRSYVREVLRPKMYSILGENEFILEAMSSSYISRNVMERFSETFENFSYRRVAVNARNPDYEADELEKEMIEYFSDNPGEEEWHGRVEKNNEKYFMRFQPVYTEESCSRCHGKPSEAPNEIIHQYGKERGFHRIPGNIYGVISVAVPIDINISQIKDIVLSVFLSVIPPLLFLFIIISIFFNRVIVQNLQNLINIFKTNLKDETVHDFQLSPDSNDEIGELTDVAVKMSDALRQNRLKLEKFAEEILHAKELLQSVFDGITDPVVLIDKDLKIKVVNKAFLKRYKIELSLVINQEISSISLHAECPLAQCQDILKNLPSFPITQQITTETRKIFLIYFYPIINEINETESVVCYLKDITEQKHLEEKMQQTEKMISIGQLAAGVAHEINNPLGVILCHIDLIQDEDNLSEETRSDLQIIQKHADNCKKIISDLLNFARQQKGSKKLYSINSLIREVVSISANQLQQQNIAIDLDLGKDIPQLRVDVDRIKQVILNMIINSSHAIQTEGFINIETHHSLDAGSVFITIEDNGYGIPEPVVKNIFDPFFTTKSQEEGTGLGLSVSYGIIKDHGGEILVDSQLGKFTRFTIVLPISEANDDT